MSRIAVVLSILMLVVFTGCSKVPEIEMQATQTAINAARTAEAELYAPEAFQTAVDTMNAAMAAKQEQDSKFKLFRSYNDSKELLVRAKVLADQAASMAAAEKARIIAEVTDLIASAQMAVDNANAALAAAPVGKGSRAEIELMKSDLSFAATALGEARADFDAGMYEAARTRAQAAIDKANTVTGEIEAAIARKAGK